MSLREEIEELAAAQNDLSLEPRARELFAELKEALNRGEVRAADRDADGTWRANAWVKSGILLGFRLGTLTDTGDITGKVIAVKDVPPLTLAQLQTLLDEHNGLLEMDAPAYSAVKHKGKALYKYARQGIAVPAKPRQSRVYQWAARGYASPDLEHLLTCSSGTYVRSLAESLGKKIGCGGDKKSCRASSRGYEISWSSGPY